MSLSTNKSSQVRPFCNAREQASWQAMTATTRERVAVCLGHIRLRAQDTLPSVIVRG